MISHTASRPRRRLDPLPTTFSVPAARQIPIAFPVSLRRPVPIPFLLLLALAAVLAPGNAPCRLLDPSP